MLVLSRRVGESILIGNEIEIKILKVERNAVKIGVEAPKKYKIYRKELYEKIMRENIEAVKSGVMELKGVLGLGEGDGGAHNAPSGSGEDRSEGR